MVGNHYGRPKKAKPSTPSPVKLGLGDAVLIINRSDSKCSACSKGCDPREDYHHTVLAYSGQSEGCGARYVAVGTDYAGADMERATRNMRSDLPFVTFWERFGA